MEAMAMGLPVVLSDITVLKESAGTTAPLYFGLDDTQNLSNLLKDMLAGKYDLQKMSCESMKAARAIAKREAFMKRIINLYSE
jgi:glycosyltransferase involved in cell wall biosynthesis